MSAKLIAFTSLLALAASRPTLSARTAEATECWQSNPGTSFYACSNGYKGCFYQDPCSLPPLSEPSTTTPPPTTSSETPVVMHNMTKPRSYNIYPLSEAQHNVQDKVGHVDLNKPAGSRITTTNAMVFDNVPAGAKNCAIGWQSTLPTDENNFTVAGSGLAGVRQLTGFPSGDEIVSYDGLKKYQDPEAEWMMGLDFAGWTETPKEHGGPSVKCGSQVAVEIKGNDAGEGENRVFITNTDTNGFYLTYDL